MTRRRIKTLGDLRQALEKYPDDTPVLVASYYSRGHYPGQPAQENWDPIQTVRTGKDNGETFVLIGETRRK